MDKLSLVILCAGLLLHAVFSSIQSYFCGLWYSCSHINTHSHASGCMHYYICYISPSHIQWQPTSSHKTSLTHWRWFVILSVKCSTCLSERAPANGHWHRFQTSKCEQMQSKYKTHEANDIDMTNSAGGRVFIYSLILYSEVYQGQNETPNGKIKLLWMNGNAVITSYCSSSPYRAHHSL